MSQLKQLNKSRMSPEALCWLKLFTKNNITVTQIHPLSLICEKGFLFFPPTMSSFYNFSINVSKILTSRVPQALFVCLFIPLPFSRKVILHKFVLLKIHSQYMCCFYTFQDASTNSFCIVIVTNNW